MNQGGEKNNCYPEVIIKVDTNLQRRNGFFFVDSFNAGNGMFFNVGNMLLQNLCGAIKI